MDKPKKKVLITGITGQDGSYLAEYLIELGVEVHGFVRKLAIEDPQIRYSRIHHILDKITLHQGSLDSYPSIAQVFIRHKFEECYHLGAQSFVTESFTDSFTTMSLNINSTHYLLASIKELNPTCRFYYAGSSEVFGKVEEVPQNEKTRFHPRSPYGISKVTGFELTRNYREAYNLYSVTGFLFNHESPRRGFEFVTRKITRSVARIKLGLDHQLVLGNLEARRDWGHSMDYVKAMYLMLQRDDPEDYVISTGVSHSVRDFCEMAFKEVGLDYRDYVVESPSLLRPAEVDLLVGDSSKARNQLGWQPEYTLESIVKEMVHNDLLEVKKLINREER